MALFNRILAAAKYIKNGEQVRKPVKAEMKLQATASSSDTLPVGSPQGKHDQSGIPRIDKGELESLLISDGVVFNTIVKTVAIIQSAKTETDKPYFFEGKSNSVRFFDNFYDNIGSLGGSTDDIQLFKRVWLDELTYGENYTENIFNKPGTAIVDLDFLDPKKMNPATDKNSSYDRIIVNEFNNPVGFVQTLPTDVDVSETRKLEVPKKYADKFSLGNNEIFFLPQMITFNKYMAIGDGLRGVGVVEPIYNTAKYKINIEDAFAQSWLRVGQPIPVGWTGSDARPATEDTMRDYLKRLKEMNNNAAIVLGHNEKLELLEPRRRFSMRDDLNHYVDGTTTGLGMPQSLALGRGDTNRAIIGTMKHFMELTLIDTIRGTLRNIERQQINRIVYYHNKSISKPLNKITPVKIRWGEFSLEELDSKANRLMKYTQAGLLTYDKNIEAEIRKLEGLPAMGE